MLIQQNGELFALKILRDFKLIYVHGKGMSLFANQNFKKNDKIIPITYEFVRTIDKATPESIQIDNNKFVDTKRLQADDFINHSCDPNARIDFKKLIFIALRDIHKNEEITYNYLTTEYDLVIDKLDFICKCGSKKCFKYIKGFKFLTHKQKKLLQSRLSPFLRNVS